MKRKLVSVLLALALCGSLVTPAFAEPVEEPPTPEESEVLTCEEDHEHEEEVVSTNEMWAGEVEKGIETDIYQQLLVIMHDSNFGTDENYAYALGNVEDAGIANIENSIHDHQWEGNYNTDFAGYLYDEKDDTQHYVFKKYNVRCAICGEKTVNAFLDGTENHSWSRGSFVRYESSAVAHKAVYNYSCSKCRATKMDGDLEPHSLKEIGYTGNNYHQGTKHYFEYQYQCTQCGYTKTQYKSYSCPGPQGGGCIMPDTPINRVEPPVELQDVTEPVETDTIEEINTSTVMQLWADSKDTNAVNNRAADHDCKLIVRRVISPGYTVKDNQHQKYNLCEVYCMYECGVEGELKIPVGEWEDHSFTTLVNGIPLNCCSGSSHQVGFEFQCECGKKEIQKEPVSMEKIDFGSDYHKGTLHYIEWIWRCPSCGYTESRWESQSCPGNNNGEGCIFGINKVEPPVEVQDVTEPEEVQTQEGTEPEEVITPEESVLPEETALPEETT